MAAARPRAAALDQLADHLGLDPGGHHRALADARLTAGLVRELLKELDATAPDRELQRWILHAGGHSWVSSIARQLFGRP